MVRGVSKCLYCKCVCVEGFRSVRIKKRFTAGPAVGRPASPARVLRAVRHLSAGHDLFSRCAQLQSQPGHARGSGDLYTHTEADTDGSTQWTKTQVEKMLHMEKIHVEHTCIVSFYLYKHYGADFHHCLCFLFFFIFIFRTRKHKGTQKYKSSDRCKMQHGSGPVLILCSLMHTHTHTHTHTNANTQEKCMLRAKPIDWITFTEHADYIVQVIRSVESGHVGAVCSGGKTRGRHGQDMGREGRERVDGQNLGETTQLLD